MNGFTGRPGFRPTALCTFYVLPRSDDPIRKESPMRLLRQVTDSLPPERTTGLYLVSEVNGWKLDDRCRYPFASRYLRRLRAFPDPLAAKFAYRCPPDSVEAALATLGAAGVECTGNGTVLADGTSVLWFILSSLPVIGNGVYRANRW